MYEYYAQTLDIVIISYTNSTVAIKISKVFDNFSDLTTFLTLTIGNSTNTRFLGQFTNAGYPVLM